MPCHPDRVRANQPEVNEPHRPTLAGIGHTVKPVDQPVGPVFIAGDGRLHPSCAASVRLNSHVPCPVCAGRPGALVSGRVRQPVDWNDGR